MKSFITKKALTLVELVISITISTVVMLIVLTFVSDSIETVLSSNKKTEIYEDLFRFKQEFNSFSRWGYFQQDLIVTSATGSQSDIILMQDINNAKWVVFWVVNKETLAIEREADYQLYYDKVLWYRTLSETELAAINLNPTLIYDLNFFPDKLFDWLKIKDFQIDQYNNWIIIDMNLEILLYYNDTQDWILLSDISSEDIISVNLNF